MAQFPGAIPTLTNPTSADNLNTAGVVHSTQHANANDEIEAIATKIGTGSSTPAANTVARGTGVGTSAWQQIVNGDVTDGTLTSDKMANRTRQRWLSFGELASVGGAPSIGNIDTVAYGWLLDPASTESLAGSLTVPDDWDSGNLTFTIVWAKTAVGTGNVVFELRTSGPDADGGIPAGGSTNDTVAVPASVGELDFYLHSRVLAGGAGGRHIGIRLSRLGADAADTYASDILVLGIRISYTAVM